MKKVKILSAALIAFFVFLLSLEVYRGRSQIALIREIEDNSGEVFFEPLQVKNAGIVVWPIDDQKLSWYRSAMVSIFGERASGDIIAIHFNAFNEFNEFNDSTSIAALLQTKHSRLKALRSILFINAQISDDLIASLNKLQKLEGITFARCKGLESLSEHSIQVIQRMKVLTLVPGVISPLEIKAKENSVSAIQILQLWHIQLKRKQLHDLCDESKVTSLNLNRSDVEDLRSGWPLFVNCKYLSLIGTNVTNEDLNTIVKLRSLEFLILRDTAIDNRSIEFLKHASNLKKLDISGTSISEKGVETLKKALGACKIICD